MPYLHRLRFAFANTFALLCLIPVPLALGQHTWPQFRGPAGDGQAVGNPPLTWSETENVRWKTAIHGLGWSSPVVWGNQIWLTTATADGKKMYVICVDRANGKVLHDVCIFENENPAFRHETNSYASPTPAVREDRVYVHFGSYGTAAIDTTSGDVIWQRRDLPCDHWRGPGSSPIVYQDRLFVAFDGYDYQYIVALDTKTGHTVWRKDRNIDYASDNGDFKKAYSTCAIVQVAGQTQLISPSAVETIAYDPANGDVRWRFRHGGMNAAARPIFGHGLVYIAVGDPSAVPSPSLIAVRLGGTGDITKSHLAWSMQTGGPKRPSLVIRDDLLFMVSDDGIARCLNAKTGDTIWKERIGGTYRASPILAGDRIYFFNLEGDMPVVAASPAFKLLASNRLDHGCQASPAAVGDSLIVRTIHDLYCIESASRTTGQ